MVVAAAVVAAGRQRTPAFVRFGLAVLATPGSVCIRKCARPLSPFVGEDRPAGSATAEDTIAATLVSAWPSSTWFPSASSFHT